MKRDDCNAKRERPGGYRIDADQTPALMAAAMMMMC